MAEVWFWQLMISPHMADLAVELARQGCAVTYVAQQEMDIERARQGWLSPSLPGVTLHLAHNENSVRALVRAAPPSAIHLCQGVRANNLVGLAQRELAALGRRQWAMMETVNDQGWRGVLKRCVYTSIFAAKRASLDGVLSNGHRTRDWVIGRGMPSESVFPFAYFLPEKNSLSIQRRTDGPFRFIFAGQLITRKRVDLLINALALLLNESLFELWIVGSGPEEGALRTLGAAKLGERVRWLGQMPLPEVPNVMAQADVLVLPSVHDGWGAVASEALMMGTPVICSDSCGVAGVVRASGVGGVFPVGNLAVLSQLVREQLVKGPVVPEARSQLAKWAACLSARAGATYLQEIFAYQNGVQGHIPGPPWSSSRPSSGSAPK